MRARGGVAIIIKENIPSTLISIHSRLQVIAVQIMHPIKITICNIYLPEFNWVIDHLKSIVDQLIQAFIFLGDFNSHNPIRGSEHLDQKGRIVEELIDEYNPVLLNTGEGTFLNSRSNTFSHLDISLCSPGRAKNFNWNVISENFFTNHAAIQIQCSTRNIPSFIPGRWQIKRAEPLEMRHAVDKSVEVITNSIICAADHSIPKSSGMLRKLRIPWWNDENHNAVQNGNRALAQFKRPLTVLI
ncbi:hypothetical protein JTB14_037459 [Gonioctena quinquepunctata]|nr:hypothetical protein JTB14_037459 [Gonioctena quinquepunctata]